MTDHAHPGPDTLVELTAADEPVAAVRVVHADGPLLTLSLALADVPPIGAGVTLRWPAGYRGRYAQDGAVVEVDENRVGVRLAGAARIEQQRNYVRGGGGEQVQLYRGGVPDAIGWIHDISEQSVRAHFADVELSEGEDLALRVLLEPDLVQLNATAVKVAALRQSLPRRGPLSVEVVALFVVDEAQALIIRRYVLRQQMLARARGTA